MGCIALSEYAYDAKCGGELFWCNNEAWWLADYDGSDPDEYTAPIRVDGREFQYKISEYTKKGPKSKLNREVTEELQLYTQQSCRRAKVYQFTSYSKGRLRIAINTRQVVIVSEEGVFCEPNGKQALYTTPPNFNGIEWSDLMKGWPDTSTQNVYALPAFARYITNRLPNPAFKSKLTTGEIQAAIRSFWLGLFIEPMVVGRPILTLIGPKGCGKSLTAKILGNAFYGKGYEVGGGVSGSRAVKDLVATVAALPLTVRDDMNNVPEDIVDTLCRLATGSRVDVAAFHETLAIQSFEARGAACITAHTPSWALRTDLLSRMLIVALEHPGPTTLRPRQRIADVVANRAKIWAETFACLAGAMKSKAEWNEYSTRFEDWEMYNRRIAIGGEWHADFHALLWRQRRVSAHVAAASDPQLDALRKFALDNYNQDKAWSAREIIDGIMVRMGAMLKEGEETNRPSSRMFTSPRSLGKFLARLESAGSTVVDVERISSDRAGIKWRIRPLE